MKRLLFLVCLVANITSFGKIWIVDNNPGSASKDFTTLQSAHDGAAAGDTLYVIGSTINYIVSKAIITKKLVIIGPGYFLSENPDTQVNISSAFIDSAVPFQCTELEFASGSSGSVVMGMDIVGRVNINANNILVKRNHIHETGCGGPSVDITASNVLIVQNFIDGIRPTNSTAPLVQVNAGQSNIVIANNVLTNNCTTCGGSGSFSVESTGSSILQISNNIINGGFNVTNAVVQNNIFATVSTFSATLSTIQNNLHVSNPLPGGNGNINNVNMTTVFIFTGSTDGQWALKSGSPAAGAGSGGTDCGIFGGLEPYVLSGIPPLPTIYSIVAPLVADKVNGLPVQIKVKSRN